MHIGTQAFAVVGTNRPTLHPNATSRLDLAAGPHPLTPLGRRAQKPVEATNSNPRSDSTPWGFFCDGAINHNRGDFSYWPVSTVDGASSHVGNWEMTGHVAACDAVVTSLIPSLSCRSSRPNAPFAELVRSSRTSTADEMRVEYSRRALGESPELNAKFFNVLSRARVCGVPITTS